MELSEPRVISKVQWLLTYLLPYRLSMNGLDPYTINHITIRFANVMSWFLGFLGVGLIFAQVSSRINPMHRNVKSLVDTLGWGFVIFMPAMLFWVSGTPSLTYGSVYWNYLGLIWYGGVYAMGVAFADVFAFRGFFIGSLARLVPRLLKAWARPIVPPYIQAWFILRPST